MATNFPSSADSFTNPTSGDTLDNPPHDQQHANINDAMEAVQAALLDGAPLHIDDANERVGIGTTSPAGTLDVNGKIHLAGGTNRYIEHRSGNNDILYHSDAGDFYRQDIANSSHQFFTGNTERLKIDSSGNVGIGDTSPSYTLDVNGDINATGDVRTNGYATGLHLVKTQTVSGTPTFITITDCFNTDFRNYRIICDNIQGASTYVYMQLGTGTGATSGYYGHWTSYTYNVNGPLSETAHSNVGPLPVAFMLSGGANYTGIQIDIYGPRTSNRTKWSSTPIGIRGVLANGLVDNNNNYTAVTFYVVSGTINAGTFRVYGYNNG